MGVLDNLRGLTRRGSRLGLEIGRRIAAVETHGDPASITASGESPHAGYSGEELGGWLRRWMDTIGVGAKTVRAIVTDGDIYHYLVTMPEMSDSERHLAAGAEVRKLAPVPASQLAYSHMAVGLVDEGGVTKQRVLISAIDKSTLRNTTEALDAADLSIDLVTTVPAALVKAAELLPPASGGQAIAWLTAGRSYLVVFRDGVLELVRDFVLRSDEQDVDPERLAELVGNELRRSFLYFGQHAAGATVDRVVLAGPLNNLGDLSHLLREQLGLSVEMFDASANLDLGDHLDYDEQPAMAAALGASTMATRGVGNLVSPEEAAEERMQRFVGVGRIAAGVVLLLLVGWGLLSLLNSTVESRRLESIELRVTEARQELDQARTMVQARIDHRARQALLEQRALESTLLGVALQRISQRLPEKATLTAITWTRNSGPSGEPYWDAQLDGFVFGDSRSESQALFNRFYTMLMAEPVVDDMHLVEPLVIGDESARTPPPLTSAVRESLAAGPQVVRPGGRERPVAGRQTAGGRQAAPGEVIVKTTLDDLPPFAATETSVGFKVAVQLKVIDAGGSR